MLILVVLFSVAFSLPSVQTKLGKVATNYLNESFDINISIKRVDVSVFGDVELKNIEILDHHLDSMIYVGKIITSIYKYREALKNNLEFGDIELDTVVFIIRTHKDETRDAFNQFMKKFETEKKDTIHSTFKLQSNVINIKNGHFKLKDDNYGEANTISINHIEGLVHDFSIEGPYVHGKVQGLRFIDNHNIAVNNFNSDFTYTKKKMLFKNTLLETETSSVKADFSFISPGSYANFKNKVQIEAVIADSNVSLRDLNKFYGEFGKDDVLHFRTKISGTLNNFKAKDFYLKSDLKTVIESDFKVKNAFNKGKGFSIDAKISNLSSDYNRLGLLLPNILFKKIPSAIMDLGEFQLSGESFISTEIIDVSVQINSSIGSAIAALNMNNIDNVDNAYYNGHIKVMDFDLGKVLKDPLIGEISMDIDVNGYGFKVDNVDTTVIGEVYSYYYKKYHYQNIDVNGRFQNKKFEGELIVDDENLKLNFNGLADLSTEIYKFDFETLVLYSDFNKLNLFTRDSIAILKGNIDIELEGNTAENLVGTINFDKTSFTNERESLYFENFDVVSSFTESIRTITINSSDIIEGAVVGNFQFVQLPSLIKNALGSIYSNYRPIKTENGQFLEFDFNIYNKIIEAFLPEVRFSSNTSVSGRVSTDENDFKLKISSPQMIAYDNIIDNIRIDIDNKNPLFNAQASIDKIGAKNYNISKFELVNATLNDTLFFRTEFIGGKKELDKYDLGFYHTIDIDGNSVVGIHKSNIRFNEIDWVINPRENRENKVSFDWEMKEFEINEFNMESENEEGGIQKIGFEGTTSGHNEKNLNMNLQNVNLESLMPRNPKWKFFGLINGDIAYSQTEEVTKPIANIEIKDFQFNEFYEGDVNLSMEGRNSDAIYNVNLTVENKTQNTLFAYGVLNFDIDEPDIDLAIEFDNFGLNILNTIGGIAFSDVRGDLHGTARLSGPLKNPDMDGSFYMFDAGLKLPYLNVDYDFKGTSIIELHDQTFEFVDITLLDKIKNTKGSLSGSISHNLFQKWRLDLLVSSDNLLVLNTEQKEGSLYFGQGFIDGQAHVSGVTENLIIAVNAKTNKGTRFVVPLNSSSSVSDSGIVNFVDGTEGKDTAFVSSEVLFDKIKGLSLNFNLEVTRDAEFEMVLDETTGSMLKGSGTGSLLIEIDTRGKFNMFGDLTIDRGVYNYNFKNVINKEFIAKPGGVISWNGNPMEAILDIETVIRVQANPKYILESVITSRDIPVDLVAKFSGELFHSTQEYDILIPDANSEIKSELDFKLNGSNDTNTLMNNFGSLLLFGTFASEENSAGDNGKMMATGIGEELLSKALTNFVNSKNSNIKLGVTYDIGDPRSQVESLQTDDQVGITLATQVNERILIDGKIGVPVGSNNQSGLVGEVEIEFLLNEDGTLRSNVFNRQNEIQYTEEEEGYTQGVGITYRFDFDTMDEFLKKIGLKKKSTRMDSLALQAKDSIALKKPLVNLN